MSYKRSAARDSADARAAQLKVSFYYAKLRTKSLPTNVRDAIFQNCVFQLSSILEDYLRDVVAGWFSRLKASGAAHGKIPIHTRALIVAKAQEEAFKRYVGLGDETELSGKIEASRNVFQLFDNASLDINTISTTIMKGKKFPSVDNLPVLFRRLGIEKIFNLLSKRTKTNVEYSLRAFMDVRNALAHESPPSITDVDVGRYFSQIEQWVGAIDRVFFSHVTKISGGNHWG